MLNLLPSFTGATEKTIKVDGAISGIRIQKSDVITNETIMVVRKRENREDEIIIPLQPILPLLSAAQAFSMQNLVLADATTINNVVIADGNIMSQDTDYLQIVFGSLVGGATYEIHGHVSSKPATVTYRPKSSTVDINKFQAEPNLTDSSLLLVQNNLSKLTLQSRTKQTQTFSQYDLALRDVQVGNFGFKSNVTGDTWVDQQDTYFVLPVAEHVKATIETDSTVQVRYVTYTAVRA